MPTHESEMLRAARNVARLQTRMRKLRRQLKATATELRTEKKMLRALITDRNATTSPDIFPSRVFGDGVGFRPLKEEAQ